MHEVKVTGVGGVPSTGVSAVVLNVTATGPTAASHLSVYPKPPRSTLYDDQGSFGAGTIPSASNLNVVAGQTVPNLVVARVGAGGKVHPEQQRLQPCHLRRGRVVRHRHGIG
ncbi:MAG: hypothetical protein R2699_12320 [Acidimicrobiales bacterium]